ncbi:hypothetical protein WMY93_030079 [Mugilogobius chulae]|uniref:Secreted protein n=1 Tax=Mugilogobius chulae TaxID=88201 RepID=A0AAW0MMN9_9GOBI
MLPQLWTSFISFELTHALTVKGLRAARAAVACCFRCESGAWSREGQGEERLGSGARRRQEETHGVTTVHASSPDTLCSTARTLHFKARWSLRSFGQSEKQHDHGRSGGGGFRPGRRQGWSPSVPRVSPLLWTSGARRVASKTLPSKNADPLG